MQVSTRLQSMRWNLKSRVNKFMFLTNSPVLVFQQLVLDFAFK